MTGGVESCFVQTGWDIVRGEEKIAADGTVEKKVYYTGFSSKTDDSARFFHYNHRGDCVMVTDSEGNVITQPEFNAYGEKIGEKIVEKSQDGSQRLTFEVVT